MSIVTVTTDFGTSDGYVGAVKGVVLAHAPDATIVDVAHDIRPQDVVAAAFALQQAAPHFPAGTVHIVVVDPGVGGERNPVVVDAGDQIYVGPDNGVLSLAIPDAVRAYKIENPGFRAEAPSTTFHGRDVFAVAAGRIAAGAAPADVGPAVELAGALPLGGDEREHDGSLFARVIHVDRFGNLITDLRGDKLPEGARFQMRGYRIPELSTTYESVAPRELLAYVGSGGTLEIAVRNGSAAEILDMARGDAVEVVA